MKKAFLVFVVTAALAALAAPLAPVTYVDKAFSNAVAQAKSYTDTHAPKVDLSAYMTKSNACFRVDSATNIVWKCVWSNGVEYIYAYSNNTNILTRTSE